MRVVSFAGVVASMLALTAPGVITFQQPPKPTPAEKTGELKFKVAPQERPSGDILFESAFALNQTPPPGEQQLRGGRVATTNEWPASLYTKFKTKSGRTASCTAALIGPEVMLTAAHCVPTTGLVRFSYPGHTRDFEATCTQHSRYSSDDSADFALCKLDRQFQVSQAPPGFVFETVDTSVMDKMLDQGVILTGFGCISDIVADDKTDKLYRIGLNTIDETSATPAAKRLRDNPYYAPTELNNLFTRDDKALANLCPGDSGGPAFRRTAGPDSFGSRVIVGVNSRVFYANPQGTAYGSSLVSGTGGPDFRTWAGGWLKKQKASACGLLGNLTACRR